MTSSVSRPDRRAIVSGGEPVLHRGFLNQPLRSASIVLMIIGILSLSPPRYVTATGGRSPSERMEYSLPSSLARSSLALDASVWAATNNLSHGKLEPVSGSGEAFDVEVGDLLNSFASTANGQLGLATDSDGDGDSHAFLVTTSTSQVVTLPGSFSNLE